MHLPQLTPAAAPPLRLPARFDPPPPAELAERLAELRARFGLRSWITPPDANAKLDKGGLAAGLTLAPASEGGWNVCARSTEGCRKACVLWNAGNGYRDNVRAARVARTQALAADPQASLEAIRRELEALAARRTDPIEAVRLNVASDLPYERVEGFLEALPPRLALYDYSKIAARIGEGGIARGAGRPYRLAFSVSEAPHSARDAARILGDGGTAVLVVAGLRRRQADGTLRYHPVPREVRIAGEWWPAVGGDRSDRRDLDPARSVVILAGKGPLELPSTGGDRVGARFAVAITSEDLRFGSPIRAAWRR
jgi:hypothetical protein